MKQRVRLPNVSVYDGLSGEDVNEAESQVEQQATTYLKVPTVELFFRCYDKSDL